MDISDIIDFISNSLHGIDFSHIDFDTFAHIIASSGIDIDHINIDELFDAFGTNTPDNHTSLMSHFADSVAGGGFETVNIHETSAGNPAACGGEESRPAGGGQSVKHH